MSLNLFLPCNHHAGQTTKTFSLLLQAKLNLNVKRIKTKITVLGKEIFYGGTIQECFFTAVSCEDYPMDKPPEKAPYPFGFIPQAFPLHVSQKHPDASSRYTSMSAHKNRGKHRTCSHELSPDRKCNLLCVCGSLNKINQQLMFPGRDF